MQRTQVGEIWKPAISRGVAVQRRQDRRAVPGVLRRQLGLCCRRRQRDARSSDLLASFQHGSTTWRQRLQSLRSQPVPPRSALHSGHRRPLGYRYLSQLNSTQLNSSLIRTVAWKAKRDTDLCTDPGATTSMQPASKKSRGQKMKHLDEFLAFLVSVPR